jgi:tetratricopeptide (TPR) repeat protein
MTMKSDALEQHSASRTIRERLLAADPANARWQEALATAFAKTGDMQRPLGRYEEALAAYDKSLAIRQQLADLDPSDFDRQRELAVSHESRGLALIALGRREEALAEFTKTTRPDMAGPRDLFCASVPNFLQPSGLEL